MEERIFAENKLAPDSPQDPTDDNFSLDPTAPPLAWRRQLLREEALGHSMVPCRGEPGAPPKAPRRFELIGACDASPFGKKCKRACWTQLEDHDFVQDVRKLLFAPGFSDIPEFKQRIHHLTNQYMS